MTDKHVLFIVYSNCSIFQILSFCLLVSFLLLRLFLFCFVCFNTHVSRQTLAEEPDRVRTLLEDVENVRRAKMYEGMGTAAQEVQQAVKVRECVSWWLEG